MWIYYEILGRQFACLVLHKTRIILATVDPLELATQSTDCTPDAAVGVGVGVGGQEGTMEARVPLMCPTVAQGKENKLDVKRAAEAPVGFPQLLVLSDILALHSEALFLIIMANKNVKRVLDQTEGASSPSGRPASQPATWGTKVAPPPQLGTNSQTY